MKTASFPHAIGLSLASIIFALLLPLAAEDTRSHPFLICTPADYTELQNKSSRAPWSSIRAEALSIFNNVPVQTNGMRIKELAGACALLYIVDPAKRSWYKSRLVNIFNVWPSVTLANDWSGTVPPGSGFFHTVLALDVVHDDLSARELVSAESNLQAVADWFANPARSGLWAPNSYGVRAIWAAYKNDSAALAAAAASYRQSLMNSISSDGVGLMGPEYSFGRFNGERAAKYGWMHVGEFTGLDPNYYDETVLQDFYEYLFSAASSPFDSCVTFMDSGHGRKGLTTFYPPTGAFTAHHFSRKAAALASWRIQTHNPRYPCDLLTYCMTDALVRAEHPGSTVWPNGGALFYEDDDTSNALMGAMWNTSVTPDHRHRETNAIYLCGYGELLLLNSGYNGWGNSIGPESYQSWNWIHDQAEASNNLLLDGNNHSSSRGEGVTESILAPRFDYARGSADRPFPGAAKHERNFFFIHPSDNANGYFLTIDDVFTDGAGEINLAWHPASTSASIVARYREYRWNVSARIPGKTTFLSVFLATAPESGVALKNGALAGWSASYTGEYILPGYPNVPGDQRSIVTLFYPHDDSHAKATMSRISGPGWSGAEVDHGNSVTDVVIANDTPGITTLGALSFDGSALIWRENESGTAFYFVRNGTEFDNGDPSRTGFSASSPVQLYMRSTGGMLSTVAGADVTFFEPGISGIELAGAGIATTPDAGGLRASIPAGTHQVNLLKSGFASWILAYYPDSPDNQATADPDRDGLDNLVEYALGLDPTRPDTSGLSLTRNGDDFELSFSNRRPGIIYRIEYSNDLVRWDPIPGSPVTSLDPMPRTIDGALVQNGGLFVRLSIEEP